MLPPQAKSRSIPLDLEPVTGSGVNLSEQLTSGRVICLLFPRAILRRIHGAACRFDDLNIRSDSRHTHDIMFAMLLLKVLERSNVIRSLVDSAYVDELDPHCVVFYLVLKANKKASNFIEVVTAVINENKTEVGIVDIEPEAAASGSAAPPQNKPPYKRFKPNNDGALRAALFSAHELVRRQSRIHVHMIKNNPAFPSPLGWGALITSPEELKKATIHWASARLAEKNMMVTGLPRALRTSVPQNTAMQVDQGDALDFGDHAPGDGPPVPPTPDDGQTTAPPSDAEDDDPNAEGKIRFYIKDRAGADLPAMEINLALAQVLDLNKFNPATMQFVRPSILQPGGTVMTIPNEPGLWRMMSPDVDLPHLQLRFLANAPVYDAFALYSEEVLGQTDALLANPRGELGVLSSFFDRNPDERDKDRGASARLLYDTCTRKDGRLPKSWMETMKMFTDMLEENNNILPASVIEPVRKYRNLTYSGNYALHLLNTFELTGTFYFHCEQFVTMMVLDGVCFRPRNEDDDEDDVANGMCGNLLCYGPPGIGKSTASIFFLSAYKFTYIPNTYQSTRSIYSNLVCADFLDCQAQYNDEAPSWIPNSSAGGKGGSSNMPELISQLKERLSSGMMVGERLVRDDKKGIHSTVHFNTNKKQSPMLMNTNEAEKMGHGPLLDRFVCRFYMYGPRAVPHPIQLDAPPLVADIKKKIHREFKVMRALMLFATKMQHDHLLPFPSTMVFNNFFELFMEQLRHNPWLDCAPPTSGDRRASIMEVMFSFLVTRRSIHLMFLDDGARFRGVDFKIEQLLELESYMASGDIQDVILAVGAYSHSFRSPTEYRCAELIRDMIVSRLRAEYSEHTQAGGSNGITNTQMHFGPGTGNNPWPAGFNPHAVPTAFDSFSPDNIDMLNNMCGTSSELRERYIGSAPDYNIFKPRYLFVCSRQWGAFVPKTEDSCQRLAQDILEGQSSQTHAMSLVHAQRRLSLLATNGARCGTDVSHRPLLIVPDPTTRETRFFVLTNWLDDCTRTNYHSMHNMLARAALAGAGTSPGTYVTLEPMLLKNEKVALAKLKNDTAYNDEVVPQLLPSFIVPLHQLNCPARASMAHLEGKIPNFFSAFHHASPVCNCFRVTAGWTKVVNDQFLADPVHMAMCRFMKPVVDEDGIELPMTAARLNATPSPSCRAAVLEYPADALKTALQEAQAMQHKCGVLGQSELNVLLHMLSKMTPDDVAL